MCRVGGGGVHFVRVVSPLCQTSNRVHVLREILGVWPVGVGVCERSYFEKVVLLLCQTSDQVPVLQEIMKVVMDTQKMPVNLSG